MTELLTSYATGLAITVAVSVGWVGVQNAWRRTFPGGSTDGDVLAGRPGCLDCGRGTDCDPASCEEGA